MKASFPDHRLIRGGQRRSLFDTYANAINWADSGQVSRALRVFEEILHWGDSVDQQYRTPVIARIRRALENDGFVLDDDLRLRRVAAYPAAPVLPLHVIRDATAIEEHLTRLEVAGDNDPALAISAAKSLMEATCKLVLEELNEDYDENSDIPVLVKAVQRALKVHPDAIAPSAKGRDTIVRTLSNLSQVAVGVAELRNEYGPDHGRARTSSSLRPRHAHLAVGSAHTFCRFLLETLRDQSARASADPTLAHDSGGQ